MVYRACGASPRKAGPHGRASCSPGICLVQPLCRVWAKKGEGRRVALARVTNCCSHCVISSRRGKANSKEMLDFSFLFFFFFNLVRQEGRVSSGDSPAAQRCMAKQHLQPKAQPVVLGGRGGTSPCGFINCWLAKQEDIVHHQNRIALDVCVREAPAEPGQPFPLPHPLRAS